MVSQFCSARQLPFARLDSMVPRRSSSRHTLLAHGACVAHTYRGMARKRKPELREEDLHGFKHFKLLVPFLERLHHNACTRDKAGNRKLHFDQYAAHATSAVDAARVSPRVPRQSPQQCPASSPRCDPEHLGHRRGQTPCRTELVVSPDCPIAQNPNPVSSIRHRRPSQVAQNAAQFKNAPP
jgi:hypothetical protein